jgi:hypothetical protein
LETVVDLQTAELQTAELETAESETAETLADLETTAVADQRG